MTLYRTALAVNGNAWEIADVLICARKLIKKRGLAAILVSRKRKGKNRSLRQRFFFAFVVIYAVLAEPWVGGYYRRYTARLLPALRA